MPDTRNNPTESIAAITKSLEELSARTTALEETVQNQSVQGQRTASSLERIFEVLEKLREDKESEQRAGKQIAEENRPTELPPLLPTPQMTPFQRMTMHNYQPLVQTSSSHESLHHCTTKRGRMDAPMFNGEEVIGWVFQMERYFEQQGTLPEHKVSLASSYFTGEALNWYQYMYTTHQLINWETLFADLHIRFGPSPYENPEVTLSKLRQTNSVVAYAAEFETLSTRTPGFSADNLLHLFLGGLRDEIHQKLILLDPKTLRSAIHMAKVAEQRIKSYRSWNNRFVPSKPVSSFRPTEIVSENRFKPPIATTGLPIRKLTPAQMAAWREKGLCYNCDERFIPGHRCKPKFQCLLLHENEEGEQSIYDEGAEKELEESTEEVKPDELATHTIPTIFYHALQGRIVPSTLHLAGNIKGKAVVVLIDSGSTHNFIQTCIAKYLTMEVEPSCYMNVTAGNGESLQCENWCPDTPLLLRGRQY